MRNMTEGNLKGAFAGESQAHMRYLAFADKAEKEGFPNIARLFRAVSFAEQVHATGHLRTLGGIAGTVENLAEAIGGENFEVDEMYPAYIAVAELQGEKPAVRSMNFALAAEKIHAAMYVQAKQAVESNQDMAVGTIYICEVCGYTVEGDAPDRCPLCNAPKDKFRAF